ncbi:MAG: beta-ketoacyl synthase chain length factor [Nitrospira sp.]
MQVFLTAVGIAGPGLDGWAAAQPILAGHSEYRMAPISRSIPEMLSAAERRRSSQSARLAIMAAQDAFRAGGLRGDEIATVFASSDGDGAITQEICDALAGPAREVSPTSFHNSVFNAPAGYWSIATHSRLASTSVCAYDVSFAAGLIEAAAYATVERQAVMLIASDIPFPAPLHTIRPVEESFAAALLLSPTAPAGSFMRWEINLEPHRTATAFPAGLPESLRSNPAARCLPLLAVWAKRRAETVALEYSDAADLVVLCEPGA